jgi:hypothetical protein
MWGSWVNDKPNAFYYAQISMKEIYNLLIVSQLTRSYPGLIFNNH